MTKKKLSFVLVVLLAVTALHACGEGEETCTCACTCGSGRKTTIEDVKGEECSNRCEANCENDSYTTKYECTTEG